MKIVIVLTSLSAGGAERVACNLAEGWVNLGYEVTLITFGLQKDDFYKLSYPVNRVSLDKMKSSKGFATRFFSNFYRVRALRKSILDTRPDIVLSLMTTTNVRTLLAGIGLGVPILVSEHTYPPKSTNSQVWQFLRRITYRYAASVIALNEESCNWLDTNTSAKRIDVIPNAIVWPLENIEPFVDPACLASDRCYFIGVGRLSKNKRFDRLISCFSRISEKLKNWDLIIVGQGDQYDDLVEMTTELQLEKRVIFTGQVGNVSDWYERSDIFVLSSDLEGFPGALLEAMAAGVPVVSVDCVTGPKDIIDNQRNGLICSSDKKSLSDCMHRMATDKDLRSRVANNGPEVLTLYGEKNVHILWDDLFESLLGRKIYGSDTA